MVLGRPGRPYSVEWASIEVSAIVITVTAANVRACSTLAKRHQRFQRSRLCSLTSNTHAWVAADASSRPVTGLTSFWMCRPMP